MRVGIDLIEIQRFENIANDEIKLQTLFTKKEIEYFNKYNHKLEHIAGNFCAKEAVVKAFKTGFRADIVPLDIEVVHEGQVPIINLKAGAKLFFEQNNFKNIDISISHDKTMATAICIIE